MILPRLGRILRSCGWSQQKPALRSAQRDEVAIEDWRERRFAELKKNALAEGRTILWADESGFYLLPALLRTWAPVGQTPVIRRKLSYDHLSAISAISLTGDLYLAVQDHAYKGPDVVEFLKQLLAEIPGKLLVIWDGAPIHRCRAVKEYLAQGARATAPVGTVARIRAGAEPGRRGLALPETGGIEERGLR